MVFGVFRTGAGSRNLPSISPYFFSVFLLQPLNIGLYLKSNYFYSIVFIFSILLFYTQNTGNMKILVVILSAFILSCLFSAQNMQAQFATTTKDFTSTEQKLVKEYCPVCTDGLLIIDESGRCCCIKKDGSSSCGKSTTNLDVSLRTVLTQQMGIGAVDPCDDNSSNCLTFKKVKQMKIPFNRLILVSPTMKKNLLK